MIKTIKIIDLLNMIVNGKYDEIKKLKMYYQSRRIYFDRTLGCNLSSIKFSDTNKKVVHSNINLLEDITIKESILDEQEKEYLRAVIRPFRNRIKHIKKCHVDNREYIYICAKGLDYGTTPFSLPCFRKNTMYKNMELDKEYLLEELEL